jgi:D-alanine-D-alanine ligase
MDQNIILLFGGESDERLVSLASAQAMAQALGESRLWFWSKTGSVYPVDFQELMGHRDVFRCEFIPRQPYLFASIAEALASSSCAGATFVLGVHGGSGEDGTLQALLEQYGHPYTGSDAQGSKRAFDKLATKACLQNFTPITMAPQTMLTPGSAASQLKEFLAQHGEIIIKPVCGGSTLGCVFIKNPAQLAEIIDQINQAPHHSFFAEKVIHGRELSVGVIDNEGTPLGLPVTEIIMRPDHKFDYEGKYLGRGTDECTPADINESTTREAQRLAVAAHVALKLEGYSRSDMILAADGLYYLETNTLPGLAKESLLPQQLAALHITLREFLSKQIKLAQLRILERT